jgi:sugar lactone lactonase YvrE
MSGLLATVARSHEHLWNGVACGPGGGMFASLPAWLGPSPGVVEVLPDGRLQPFPGNAWNTWAPGRDPARAFVDVNSIHADGRGSLWVVDAAAPRFGDAIAGAVKLVQLDIASGAVRRVIAFKPQDAHPGTRLAHMRVHGDHAFVLESREASMFVVDLRDGRYRRVLVGHALMRCLPEDVPVVEGVRMRLKGEPMYFHSDLLEFGADADTLLFMCLFGRKVFQVPVHALKDASLNDQAIARQVSVAFTLDRPFVSGIARDRHGTLYLADAERGGISRLNTDGTVAPLVRDVRLIWPMAPSLGADGCLYFVDSQVNRIPLFTGGPDRVARPWKLYRLPVAHQP